MASSKAIRLALKKYPQEQNNRRVFSEGYDMALNDAVEWMANYIKNYAFTDENNHTVNGSILLHDMIKDSRILYK